MFAVDSMLSQKIKEQYKSLTAKPIVQSVAQTLRESQSNSGLHGGVSQINKNSYIVRRPATKSNSSTENLRKRYTASGIITTTLPAKKIDDSDIQHQKSNDLASTRSHFDSHTS